MKFVVMLIFQSYENRLILSGERLESEHKPCLFFGTGDIFLQR